MKLFAPFAKVDAETRIVSGYASTEALDSQNEIVKREAIERALPDYMKFGNIREMHQPSAVGVAVTATMDDTGLLLEAHVVDDAAWKKCEAGVYKGFSIGGRVTNRDKVNKSIITGLHLTEISIVDRPANPEALFDVWKADGSRGDDVTKGMFNIQDFAAILTQIKYLQEDCKWEELMEGDTASQVPEGLLQWLKDGGVLLSQMVTEETNEMTGQTDEEADALVIELADKAIDLAKGGKRNSKSDQKKLNEAHEAIVAAGADCGDDEARPHCRPDKSARCTGQRLMNRSTKSAAGPHEGHGRGSDQGTYRPGDSADDADRDRKQAGRNHQGSRRKRNRPVRPDQGA